MPPKFQKFIPFVKIDEQKRQVFGIVTAERPDKDDEVCDYEKSKPFYRTWSDELKKNSDGENLGNLREMHQLKAAGRGIEFELRDESKSIYMGFEVVDDDAWKKVLKRVYTGFSQGGRKVGEMWPDPIHKGCMRYVANPSEISLVDNPCLPNATFSVVKADGQVTVETFQKTEDPLHTRLLALEEQVSLMKAAGQTVKTKKIGDKDLPASAFAYVGNADDTNTWKLRIDDVSQCRKSLALYRSQVSAKQQDKVFARIVAACKKFGLDVSSESKKAAAVRDLVFKRARVCVNRLIASGKPLSKRLEQAAFLNKSLYHTAGIGQMLESFASLYFSVVAEQQWEDDDDSVVPAMLAENIGDLVDTFLASANEESSELKTRVGAAAA